MRFSQKYFFVERAVKACVIRICLRQCYDACLHENAPGTTPAEQCGPADRGSTYSSECRALEPDPCLGIGGNPDGGA